MALLVILSWVFVCQSDNFCAEYWARLPRCWLRHVCISTTLIHRGDDLPFTASGNHISDKCRFFSGVFRDFTFSLMWRVDGAHAPSAVTAALGDSCPLTTWWLLAGCRLLYISLGPSTYHEAKPGLSNAAISQSHCY